MSSARSDSRFIAAVVVVFLLAATAAWAQSTANLQGTITDQTGAVVPNAQVKATNQATNLERTTTSDSTGNYL
ncbi:MAG: carboxypeptidase-like regulatory domain-containing protein, partial [Terriglobales bacterium]